MTIETKTLFLDTIAKALAVSDVELMNTEVVQHVAVTLSQNFIVGVRGFLWGEKVGEKTIAYPANWWEHFKKSIGLKHKTSKTTVTFKAYYPDFKVLPQLGRASLQVAVHTMPPATWLKNEWESEQ